MAERLGFDKVVHMLRNPHGFKEAELRAARLEAADRMEGLQDAYLNMREWAEKNGVDTMARGNAGCTPGVAAAPAPFRFADAPKPVQDALLAYHARPCDAEAGEVVRAVLAAHGVSASGSKTEQELTSAKARKD